MGTVLFVRRHGFALGGIDQAQLAAFRAERAMEAVPAAPARPAVSAPAQVAVTYNDNRQVHYHDNRTVRVHQAPSAEPSPASAARKVVPGVVLGTTGPEVIEVHKGPLYQLPAVTEATHVNHRPR